MSNSMEPSRLAGCFASSGIQIDVGLLQDMFKGAVLVAPMLSLDRVSKSGLNPYLRCNILAFSTPALPFKHAAMLRGRQLGRGRLDTC